MNFRLIRIVIWTVESVHKEIFFSDVNSLSQSRNFDMNDYFLLGWDSELN